MTTAAAATTRSRFGWIRTLVLTVGIALLGVTLLPPAAGAEADINANVNFQIALCEAGGGTAEVDATRTPGAGLIAVDITCHGGVYDGMNCFTSPYGVTCTGAHPRPVPFRPGSHLWQLKEVMPILESGSVAQIAQVVAAVEAVHDLRSDAGSRVVSPDDQQQDQDTTPSKHKKGKHGKKGGKHRKR
jgi:hypothetical protein